MLTFSTQPAPGDARFADADDVALMRAIALGEEGALRIFFDRYRGMVFGLCLRAIPKRGDAEEVTVDIFHEIWERADRYDPDRASPRTYLMMLARSRAIDRARKTRNDAAALSDDVIETAGKTWTTVNAAPHPHQPMRLAEDSQAVRTALNELDEDQRRAVQLAFFHGLTHREISERLDVPLGTIKSRIRLALEKLRDRLSTIEATGGAN